MKTNSSLVKWGAGFISNQMLAGHLDGLEESARIDMLAAPVQAMNLPIICQDVPYIPPAP
jgi:hypothetical protein